MAKRRVERSFCDLAKRQPWHHRHCERNLFGDGTNGDPKLALLAGAVVRPPALSATPLLLFDVFLVQRGMRGGLRSQERAGGIGVADAEVTS